jgi:hypothetical protein
MLARMPLRRETLFFWASEIILFMASIIYVSERIMFRSLRDSPAEFAQSQMHWSIICRSFPCSMRLIWLEMPYFLSNTARMSSSSPYPILVKIQVASSYKMDKWEYKVTYFQIANDLILIVLKPENLLNYAQYVCALNTVFNVWLGVFCRHFLSDFGHNGELLNAFQILVLSQQI